MTSAIEVVGLRKSYGDHEAVRGVSFTVDHGEVLALLGPNGAGKTTTVEILEGYRSRSAGEVRVLGHDPATAAHELRQRVGIVLQTSAIDRFLSVREVVEMYAGYYAHPRPIDEVIELVGLTAKRDDRVRTLSGGQQRRLDVALGLVGDPDVLFLDEPTTGFDPAARRLAWDLVRALKGLGKTVLLTTHYMEEAQALADRIVILSGGLVVADGSAETIGGRLTRGAVVRFAVGLVDRGDNAVIDHDVADELGLAGIGPAVEPTPDGAWTFVSSNTTADLHTLTGWAITRGVHLDGLQVNPPSLEDVYLELTDEDGAG